MLGKRHREGCCKCLWGRWSTGLGVILCPWHIFRQKSLNFTSHLFPLILTFSALSGSHRPMWAPSPGYLLFPLGHKLPTGPHTPADTFTSQQNANVISALQDGER